MPRFYRSLLTAVLAGMVALPAFAQTPAPATPTPAPAAPVAASQPDTATPAADEKMTPPTKKPAVHKTSHHSKAKLHTAAKTAKPAEKTPAEPPAK